MDINSVIDNLCARFGTTTAYLIPEMARYNIAKELFMIIFSIIVIIIVSLICKRGYSLYKHDLDCWENDEEWRRIHCLPDWSDFMGYWIASGIPGIVFAIILMANIYAIIGWLTSPTAAFVDTVLTSIGGR